MQLGLGYGGRGWLGKRSWLHGEFSGCGVEEGVGVLGMGILCGRLGYYSVRGNVMATSKMEKKEIFSVSFSGGKLRCGLVLGKGVICI